MPEQFLNPYHFVPVSSSGRNIADVADPARTCKEHPCTHERFVPGARSGELRCRVTLKTPAVIGAQQISEPNGQYRGYKRVANATRWIGGQEVPVIPASSLRGMVGGVLETLTKSALRVLDPKAYSVRRYMNEALSALGMVLKKDGKWLLMPLTVPNLDMDIQGNIATLPKRFRKLFPDPFLRVYYGQRGEPTATDILNAAFPFRSAADEYDLWYLKVPNLYWDPPGNFSLPLDGIKNRKEAGNLLLGLSAVGNPTRNPDDGVPGYMRVLGCWGPERENIPRTKKHELFLPQPWKDSPEVEIPSAVIARFEEIAGEHRPFYPRQEKGPDQRDPAELRHGDIVYFDVDAAGDVSEIAFSAIWRTRPETSPGKGATAWDFFPAELRPYNSKRTTLSSGELMLGFVSEDERAELPAFASRIRFSDGLPRNDPDQAALFKHPYLPDVPLRILSSPKPPCPAMYFKPADDGKCVKKTSLKPGVHQPQGRKFYLHHFWQAGDEPWKTTYPNDDKDQKHVVTPLRHGLQFEFFIRYENLSNLECMALVSALGPFADFHHKLGLGKSIGLGSVKIDLKWHAIDRASRYTLAGLRHDRARVVGLDVVKLRNAFIGLVQPQISNALRLIGRIPTAATPPVETPTVEPLPPAWVNNDQKRFLHDREKQTFRWFVANDVGAKETYQGKKKIQEKGVPLRPIASTDLTLPTLEKYEWTDP